MQAFLGFQNTIYPRRTRYHANYHQFDKELKTTRINHQNLERKLTNQVVEHEEILEHESSTKYEETSTRSISMRCAQVLHDKREV